MSLAFEMKVFCVWKWFISQGHGSQSVPKCEFENGCTTVQMSIMHGILNILSLSLLPWEYDTSGYVEVQKQ